MSFPNLHIERGHDPAWKKGPPERVPTVGSPVDDLDETFASGGYEHQGERLFKAAEAIREALMQDGDIDAPLLEPSDWGMLEEEGYTIGEASLAKRVQVLGDLAKTVGKPHLHKIAVKESVAAATAITRRLMGMRRDCEAYIGDLPCTCEVVFTADVEADHAETVRFLVDGSQEGAGRIARIYTDEDEAYIESLMRDAQVGVAM